MPARPVRRASLLLGVLSFGAGRLHAQQSARADSARSDSLRPVLLRPVVVTVTRSPADLDHVPFAVAAIPQDEMRRGRATTGLSETLVTVPGVYIADRHNPSQDDNLSVRGFGARSAFGVRGVKVLLDGIPQTLPDGQGQLSNVELAGVNRIEVLRGPSSSLYGNASGGVISLSTNPATPPRVAPSIHSLAGAYGLRKYYGGIALPVGTGAIAADASYWVTDGNRAHSAGETRRASLRYRTSLGAQTRITGQVLWADSPRLQDPGALDSATAYTDSTRLAANPRNLVVDAGKSVSQEQGGIALEHRTAAGPTVGVTLFGLRRDLDNPTAAAYIQLGRWAYGVRTSLVHPLSIGQRAMVLTAGVDAQWQRDDRINFTTDRTRLTRDQLEHVAELGPFVQARLQLTPVAGLLLGARYDRVAFRVDDRFLSDGDDSGSRVMAAPSLSAGLACDLNQAFQPYLNASTSFDTPTTTELANRPTGPGGFNPDLQPQKAVNLEAGVRGRVSAVLGYELSAYQANVRDELIPFEVPGDPGRRFFRNAGSARHRGFEAGAALSPAGGVTLVAAYTFTAFRFETFRTSTDTLDGKTIPGVPAHYLYGSLRFRAPAGFWNAVDLTASSGYYVNDVNSVRTTPWQTVGVRLGWDGRAGGWRIAPFAAVQNLFDQRYIGSVSVNAQFGRYFEPAPGRNAYFGLEVRPF